MKCRRTDCTREAVRGSTHCARHHSAGDTLKHDRRKKESTMKPFNPESPAGTYDLKTRVGRLQANIAGAEDAAARHMRRADAYRIAADALIAQAKELEGKASSLACNVSGWNAMLAEEVAP